MTPPLPIRSPRRFVRRPHHLLARVGFAVAALAVPVSAVLAQTLDWSVRQGGPSDNADALPGSGNVLAGKRALAVDASGNIYVTGRSQNGSNLDYLTVAYDGNGNLLWSRLENGTGNNTDEAYALAVGESGSIYVTGRSFGAGSSFDFLTVAYDASGNKMWARAKNGSPGNLEDGALAVAVGENGYVYVTGRSHNGSNYDLLTVAYDSSGNELWARVKNGSGNGHDSGAALAVDGSGNVYVTGVSTGIGTNVDYLTVAYDSGGNELWARYKDGESSLSDEVYALASDIMGHIHVTGRSYNGTNYDYLTVSYDSNGNELWTRIRNGAVNGDDEAFDLATDASGNIFVTGRTYGAGAITDYLTVAYDNSGSELWARVKNGSNNGNDGAFAMVADGNGNVYVTGYSSNGSNYDYLTVAYDGAGNELWTRVRNGAGSSNDNGYALALGGNGRVYASGSSHNGTNNDFLTLAYDTDGNELWARKEPPTRGQNDKVGGGLLGRGRHALAVDAGGNVYVTGYTSTGSDKDYLTVAYDGNGSERWSRIKTGAAPGGEDWAFALATGAGGNVYVTGRSHNGANFDFLTVAYDDGGNELWSRVKNGAGNGIDEAHAVAVDGSGNVYVTGHSHNGSNFDYLTVAYDAGGNELWTRARNGAGNGHDYARSLAVDESGTVHVTGHSSNGANDDFLTVAYDSGGSELWARARNGAANGSDLAYDLALDGGGNLYVTGRSYNGSNHDFMTVAYDGSGTELWTRVRNGAANADDYAHALAADEGGNVYVTGVSSNGSNWDYLTVGYDSGGNELWARAKNGAANGDDRSVALASGVGGKVYVTGDSFNGSNLDYLTVAYDASGDELWSLAVDEGGADEAIAVAVDTEGGVLVSGSSVGSGWDFFTLRVTTPDTVPPTDPSTLAAQAPHVEGTWSSQPAVTMEWSGAADEAGGSGLAGYSVEWNTTAVATPDATVDVAQATDPHTFTTSLGEGGGQYFHLRTCDVAGNCTATLHRGPYGIDLTAPSMPGAVASASHDPAGTPVADATIDAAWGAATDGLSGVASYRFAFDGSASGDCAGAGVTAATSATSGTLADGSWYVHVCATDVAGNTGAATHGGPWIVDLSPPSGMTLSSTSHATSVWSNDATVDFSFPGAADANGVAGYSVTFDATAGTEPVCSTSQTSTTYTGTASPDGDSWWFHVRARDVAGNCSATLHLGPFWIDAGRPAAPTGLSSSSHEIGVPSNDTTIDASWTAAADPGPLSGIDGYSWDVSPQTTPLCDGILDVEEGTLSLASDPLADGSWYVHVCARDNAGNWSDAAVAGPYVVDTAGSAVLGIETVSDTGDGELGEDEPTGVGITQLHVRFESAMADPVGDSSPEDVTNPSNYQLVAAGPDQVITTLACGAPAGDDVAVAAASVEALEGATLAVLRFASPLALPRERYRLLVCSTLEDDAGTPIAAFARNFRVTRSDRVFHPNFDSDLSAWIVVDPQPGALQWSSDDAGGAPTSGSAETLTAAGSAQMWAIAQCLDLVDGPFDASARVAIDSATVGAPMIRVRLDFFQDASCTGSLLDSALSPPVAGDTGGDWLRVRLTRSTAPPGASSALVAATIEGGTAGAFSTTVDDFYFGSPDPIFVDGFESGDTCAWTDQTGGGCP